MESQQQVTKKLKSSHNSDLDSMDTDEISMLELDKESFAAVFLDNDHFYGDVVDGRKVFAKLRNDKFRDQTIGKFFKSVQSVEGLKKALIGTGIHSEMVIPFYEKFSNAEPPEDYLNKRIVHYGGVNEIKLLKNFVKLPIYEELRIKNNECIDASESRKDDIRFVLGSSGSGKTFFSLKVAAVEGLSEPYVVVYIKVSKISNAIALNPEKLVEFVKKQLRTECTNKNLQMPAVLDLNLSLILDEAGSTKFNKHFDDATCMDDLYKAMGNLVVGKRFTRLVLCGTGVTGINFGSDGGAKKYRMKAWSKEDFKEVASKHSTLGDHSELDSTTLNTIRQHPQLKALITNARSAWFLLDAIMEFMKFFKATGSDLVSDDRIKQQIYDFAPYIVGRVVSSYISANGIQSLGNIRQRRVAAYVFDALEKSRIFHGNDNEYFTPEFDELKDEERDVAFSLISINVESYNDGTKRLVTPDGRSISVTPAITIILYWMCGVSIEIVSDWKMQELLSALYEFRHQLRQLVQKYSEDRMKAESSECDRKLALEDSLSTFENGLKLLRIIKLKKRVPEPRASKSFRIPNVDNRTIWINQDMAPFADVVAPFTFYQCKYTTGKDDRSINLMEELEKCGLLYDSRDNPNNEIGWIITKSLEHTWKSNIDQNGSNIDRNGSIEDGSPSDSADATKSIFFYPDTQLTGKKPKPIEDYCAVKKPKGDWIFKGPTGKKKINLKKELSKDLFFIISCNRSGISLLRNEIREDKSKIPHTMKVIPHTMKVNSTHLDDDGNIKEDDLPPDDRAEWEYCKTLLRKNVKVRFLLS